MTSFSLLNSYENPIPSVHASQPTCGNTETKLQFPSTAFFLQFVCLFVVVFFEFFVLLSMLVLFYYAEPVNENARIKVPLLVQCKFQYGRSRKDV